MTRGINIPKPLWYINENGITMRVGVVRINLNDKKR